MERYPLKMQRLGQGDLTARDAREEAAYQAMGWLPVEVTAPTYGLFPMWLHGDGLPDIVVENEAEARAAALKGYCLPSDIEIEAAKEAFAAQFVDEDPDYEVEEYPKWLRHPDFVPEVPGRWDYPGPGARGQQVFIAAVPAKFPPVLVNNPTEELNAFRRGWTIGPRTVGSRQAREEPAASETTSESEGSISASPEAISRPARHKLSGAARRRLDRARAEREIGA
jgi:hypothetical protein